MITRSDWRLVNQQRMADERGRLGEPPTAEEMLAYTRGELSDEEEARVRERLAVHPDLVRTLTEPFPMEGAQPGDADYVSDEDFAARWPVLQKRMRHAPPADRGRVLQFYKVALATAASLLLVLGGMLWQTRVKLSEPRIVWGEQLLLPEGRRGPSEALTLRVQGDSILLVIPWTGQREFNEYRLEIVRAATSRSIWSGAGIRLRPADSFAILVPRRFLDSGEYRIVVYGVTGSGEESLATYSVRVE